MHKLIGLAIAASAMCAACGGGSKAPTTPTTTASVQGPTANEPVPGGAATREVEGAIDSLTGSASSFQFKIGSNVVKGDSSTTFSNKDDKPDTFASLKNGLRVDVHGLQGNGVVQASAIHIEDNADNADDDDDNDNNNDDVEADITGRLNGISGVKPNLTLIVGTTTVMTTGSTQIKQRGNLVTLDALQTGQSLEVEGTRQSNTSITARKISIEDDDAAEAEVEGAIATLKGNCPSITFTVNGTPVTTSSSTRFDNGACSSLKNGDKVEVKGTRPAGGPIAATRVERKE
jgi:hypothetical protein